MGRNTIHETAQQTADKLKVELQHTYPGVVFNLVADEQKDLEKDIVPHIIVEWTDGPTTMEVDNILRLYESAEDARFEQPIGYYIRDQHYIGAYFIVPERTLSPARYAKIMEKIRSFGYTEKTTCIFQMEHTEADLIAAGTLESWKGVMK